MPTLSVKRTLYACCPRRLRPHWERLEASELGYRLAKGAFWSLTGTAIGQASTLAASIVTARVLGAERFGEFGMINGTIGALGVFAGLGLGLTATKFVAEHRRHDPARAGRIVGLSAQVAVVSGAVISLILFVLAPLLAARTLNAPHLVPQLRLGCALLFLNALNGMQTGALSGLEAFKSLTRVNLLRGLSNFPLMIAGVWCWGLEGAVGAAVGSAALGWWLTQAALTHECRKAGIAIRYGGVAGELSILWKFSLPAFLSGVMSMPALWIATSYLVNQPGGYAELGGYNAVMLLKRAVEFLPVALMSPLLPILSEQYARKDSVSYGRTLFYAYEMSIGLLVPASLFAIAAPGMLLAPYGQEFLGYTSLAQWLMFHTLLVGLFAPLGNVLPSMDRMWFGFFYNLVHCVIFLLLSWFLIPVFRGSGLAIAYSVTHMVTSLFNFAYVHYFRREYLGNFPVLKCVVASMVLSLLSAVAAKFLPPGIAVASGVLGVAFSTGLLWNVSRRAGLLTAA
jgi:O-antigen/teichoic acid export membrane protein